MEFMGGGESYKLEGQALYKNTTIHFMFEILLAIHKFISTQKTNYGQKF